MRWPCNSVNGLGRDLMLNFDIEGMKLGLMEVLYKECAELTHWIWTQVGSMAPPEVRRDMIEQDVLMVGGMVFGTVSAGGIGALTTEWGSGSLADESNPAWKEYVESQYWNDSRWLAGHPITGRPAGSYVNLDGETMISAGAMDGLNLEGFLRTMEPQHWMRGIVELSRPYVLERLVQMVQAFPFHKYIYSNGR